MWVQIVVFIAASTVFLPAQESVATLSNPFTSDADVAGGEKIFLSQCASCHGRDGRGGASGPDLSSGRFKRATSDESIFQIVNKGIPGTTMPGFMLNAGPVWKVVAYIRSLGLSRRNQAIPGDAARGQALYAKHRCAGCHDSTAPDLKLVAGNRTASELRQSVLEPGEDVPSAYWRVTASLKAGGTVTGARLNEDTFTMQVRDKSGALRSFDKAALSRVEIDRSSPMPSFRGKLSEAELDDLLSYISRGSAQ
jgi:cytochrome c oxidase cbb3-type subunit III